MTLKVWLKLVFTYNFNFVAYLSYQNITFFSYRPSLRFQAQVPGTFNVLNDNSEIYKGLGLLVVTSIMRYAGATFTMKMNSNDYISCESVINNQNINVLKLPYNFNWSRFSPTTITLPCIWVIRISPFFHIGRDLGSRRRSQELFRCRWWTRTWHNFGF